VIRDRDPGSGGKSAYRFEAAVPLSPRAISALSVSSVQGNDNNNNDCEHTIGSHLTDVRSGRVHVSSSGWLQMKTP
jgi:hypothetical protein